MVIFQLFFVNEARIGSKRCVFDQISKLRSYLRLLFNLQLTGLVSSLIFSPFPAQLNSRDRMTGSGSDLRALSRTSHWEHSLIRVFLLIMFAGTAVAQTGDYSAAHEGGNYMVNYYIPPAPSTTPWAPSWSPDGESIAVSMQGSIWKIDPKKGIATELTYGPGYHSSPSWSPDGNWIVYTDDDDGRSVQLEIVDLRNGKSQALTSGSDVYLDPAFSPDGQTLAYVSTRPNGHFNIFTRSIRDGRWNGDEVAVTLDSSYERPRLSVGLWDMHIEPEWARDGREIFFVCNHGVPLGSGNLWRAPAEANGMSKGKVVLPQLSMFRTRPHVSPDGTRIVYSSTSGGVEQFNQLYLLPSEGGVPYKLTLEPHDHFHPRWSPNGHSIAYISNEGGLPQLHILEVEGGADTSVVIRKHVWKRPMGAIHARVVDETSGRPLAARIQYLCTDGKFYAPSTVFARIGVESRQHAFHTQGEFTAAVPPGKMRLIALKGFEYRPAETEVEVRPNSATDVVLRLHRLTNMRAKGWYSGSTHVHMNYGGNFLNSVPNSILMSEAEDQDVLNLMVANKDTHIFDWQYFRKGGVLETPSTAGVKVIVGEEYRPPFLGHVSFIGLNDHLISPFTNGYEGTALASLYPSNTDILREASAQQAVTSYVHPYTGDTDPLDNNLGEGRAFPVDAALGVVNCLEWSFANHAELSVWHHALNMDMRIVPTGGEDSISDLQRSRFVGTLRTYAYTGETLTARAWMNAIRRGHTFFSSGPLLEFYINGQLPGDDIHLPAGGGTIEIEGSTLSFSPLNSVVIYNNGSVLKRLPTSGSFKFRLSVKQSGWYSLYAEGTKDLRIEAQYPQASTNAIRVYVGEQKIQNSDSAKYFVRWIDKLTAMTEAWPWWRSPAERDQVLHQFGEARAFYRARESN